MKIIILSLSAIAIIGAAVALTTPQIRFTVHVTGEDENPLSGIKCSFIFHPNASHQDQYTQVKAVSDENGNFTVEGPSQDGTFAFGELLNKDGYYPSGVNIPSFLKTDTLGHWLPWDVTYTTVLRKIGNPIPMYARELNITTPTLVNQSCGFDLEEADWVAPYGKGKIADFIFTVTQAEYHSDNDYNGTITLSFSNLDDGIKATQLPKEFANSRFTWPREAPETGYQPTLEAFRSWHSLPSGEVNVTNSAKDDQVYFFRVRTEKQGDKIISALYGKIQGGIRVGPTPTQHGFINFLYYLNPTPNDRNMEYDPKQDLFKGLTFPVAPRDP